MPEQLFLFIQMEFPWALGPRDGRYLLRSRADADPERVVVLSTLGAERPSRSRPFATGRRRGTLSRRVSPRSLAPATPEPAPVATARVTIVDPVPVAAERQAQAWLADLDVEREAQAAVLVLNRVLHFHRIATADPYVHEVSPAQALVIRAGWGAGEQVADGRWLHARQLPAGVLGPARSRSRRGRARTAALRPEERLAVLLGGRGAALLCEELALRAHLDLDQGRTGLAAIQLDCAFQAALRELPAEGREDLAVRLAELEELRAGVAIQSRAALTGASAANPSESADEPPDEEVIGHALDRLQAALRARTATGFGRCRSLRLEMDPTSTAIGTWSGGRFMRFGEPLDDERFAALVRPGDGIDTVITADVYGAGDADRALGAALRGVDRDAYCLIGAIGHDFYEGQRDGARGFPRFTDPRLRPENAYAGYIRAATERSLERCGVERFDLLLLHNPDRIGYTSPAVWAGMQAVREAGLTRMLGVAPGPANGFTLDLIDCLERFSSQIEWAMIILGPLEPWPGELVLEAAAAHEVSLITRVVDHGGLFHDDVLPGHSFAEYDHRAFRPSGWVRAGREKLERMRPYAERHGLSMLQLACAWNLALPAVRCVAPTLIQESGPAARPIEVKRAELAAVSARAALTAAEVRAIRAIGDNTGCMALKGASPDHEGPERPDRWRLDEERSAVADRWGIDPERDLLERNTLPANR